MKCHLAAALLLLSASSSVGQGGPSPAARRDPEMDRVRDEQRRAMQLRKVGEEDARAPDERAVKAAVKQLGEDFRRIQVIRNDVARSLVAASPLDYARVSEQAAEVHKRALRMKAYLALDRDPKSPKAGEAPPAEAPKFGETELKGALVRLCKTIDGFVANPRFTSPDVLNVAASALAGRDLEEIITLSEGVRESALKLSHAGASAKRPEH